MAKLRGESARLEIETTVEADDGTKTTSYKNVAGEMTTNGSFDTATDVADTKDNKSGWSLVLPTTISGTLDLSCKYATDVEKATDLEYKDLFELHKGKTIFNARFNTDVFTIQGKFVVLSLDLTAANSSVTEYSVSLGYAEKPTFTEIT